MKTRTRKRRTAPKITPEMLDKYFESNRDVPFKEWFHDKVVDLIKRNKKVAQIMLTEIPDWAAEIVKESQSGISKAEAEELLSQGYIKEKLEDGTILYIPPELIKEEERSGSRS